MPKDERRATYTVLCVFALALGWIEAAVVVYLRELYYPGGFRFPVILMPSRLVVVETVREACTLVVLGAVAWLAARRTAARMGAFLLLFGVWDLTYYGVLKLVLGWPDRLATWDILFLIPLPWIGPVWAPGVVAVLFVIAGSYLFWTADRSRSYRRQDVAVLILSAVVIIAAFLAEWRVVADERVPQEFPVWLFWAGVLLGISWFLHVERRSSHGTDRLRAEG